MTGTKLQTTQQMQILWISLWSITASPGGHYLNIQTCTISFRLTTATQQKIAFTGMPLTTFEEKSTLIRRSMSSYGITMPQRVRQIQLKWLVPSYKQHNKCKSCGYLFDQSLRHLVVIIWTSKLAPYHFVIPLQVNRTVHLRVPDFKVNHGD